MTPDDVRAFVQDHAEHWASRDAALLAADHAENGVVESPTTGTHHGRHQIEQSYERWFDAFPDLEFTIENVVADHDQAAVFFCLTGTHQSTFLGLPATGKRIEFRGVLLERFESGQLVHERRIHDFTGLMVRLGVLKVKPG